MKQLFYLSVALLFAACSHSDVDTDKGDQPLTPLTIRVNEFSFEQETIAATRAAQNVADYTDVKAIDLAFFVGNTKVYATTQIKGNTSTYTTFGEFQCALPIGTYTMVVIARAMSDGDEFTLTSPTQAAYETERPRETFCTTQTVTVKNTTPLDLSVTLNRIMAMLRINSSDTPSPGVARIRTSYAAGSKAFNPTTGLATDNNGFSLTTSAGTTNGHLNVYSNVFLISDEQTMDVTIEALDAFNTVLFSKTIANVPFKRNRVTRATGPVFTAESSALSFQLEAAWETEENITF